MTKARRPSPPSKANGYRRDRGSEPPTITAPIRCPERAGKHWLRRSSYEEVGTSTGDLCLIAKDLWPSEALEDISILSIVFTEDHPHQMIERTTPPSTRSAAPLVAAESGLAMNVTSEATSSVEAKRLSNELGRMVAKNSFSAMERSTPRD